MSFKELPEACSKDEQIRRLFVHASNYLSDVYTMLGANPSKESKGGHCNFSIALVLSCILDGLATEISPIEPVDGGKAQFTRMRALVLRMRFWGTKKHHWITPIEAAHVLYTEIRNPLVHNLGADTRPRVRRQDFKDAAVVHPMRDRKSLAPDEIEEIDVWPERWPVMWAKDDDAPGPKRIVVAVPALYWHVKRLALEMATDEAMLKAALQLRNARRVKPRDEE